MTFIDNQKALKINYPTLVTFRFVLKVFDFSTAGDFSNNLIKMHLLWEQARKYIKAI